MFYPNTMMESLGLDKLEKDGIITQQGSQSTFVPFKNMVSQIPPTTPTPKTTPIKHLSKAEMWERREKGLCYNFDEKFTQGHRFAKKNLYLLDADSLPAPKICEDAQDPVYDQVIFPTLARILICYAIFLDSIGHLVSLFMYFGDYMNSTIIDF